MQSSLLDDPDFAPAGASREKATNPLILAELADGERLVWVGQPQRRRAGWIHPNYRILFVALGVFVGALGLVAVLFGLSQLIDRSIAPDIPILLGFVLGTVALCLIGVGLRDLIGLSPAADGGRPSLDPVRNWFDRRYDRRIENTWYALTDRRIILWKPVGFGSFGVRSLRPKDFTGISRTERPDGSGTIVLEVMAVQRTGVSLEIMAVQPVGISGPIPLGSLCQIDDVHAVEALIRATLFGD